MATNKEQDLFPTFKDLSQAGDNIGRLLLEKIQFDQWWVEHGTAYELPLYGQEMLGSDF